MPKPEAELKCKFCKYKTWARKSDFLGFALFRLENHIAYRHPQEYLKIEAFFKEQDIRDAET